MNVKIIYGQSTVDLYISKAILDVFGNSNTGNLLILLLFFLNKRNYSG